MVVGLGHALIITFFDVVGNSVYLEMSVCAGRWSRARALPDWRGVCRPVSPRGASCPRAALGDPPYPNTARNTKKHLLSIDATLNFNT